MRIVVVLVICCCLPQMMSFYLSVVIMTMAYCFLHTAVSEHFLIALTIWKSIAWFEMGFFQYNSLFVSLSSQSFTVLIRIGVKHLAMLCIIFPCLLFCIAVVTIWRYVRDNGLWKFLRKIEAISTFLCKTRTRKINKLFIKPIYDLEQKKNNSFFC